MFSTLEGYHDLWVDIMIHVGGIMIHERDIMSTLEMINTSGFGI